MEMSGLFLYLVAMATMGGIYAVLALGLNLQWGYGGLFNAGIAGFFAIGAYTSAILTVPPQPGGAATFGLPLLAGFIGAMVLAGAVAWVIGRICLKLESDYLAIATIGIAEIIRLIVKNEQWLTGGAFGIQRLPKPFDDLALPWSQVGFLSVILLAILLCYLALERASNSPWGRVMRAIRDNPNAAAAVGKDVAGFRLQAFVLGSMVMGLGGALTAHYFKFIGPEATEPVATTFIVWVMVVAGGAGNNRGVILGGFGIWALWSLTEILTLQLPPEWATRTAYIRVFLIGLLLQVVLQRFPGGLLPERKNQSR